mmetsp:Transcript_101801/g.180538  ORF Transcript_101801/g.180538 Transcript_101801/m.180538 type:complete len:206 (+) Transcript_101801:382-999(+)
MELDDGVTPGSTGASRWTSALASRSDSFAALGSGDTLLVVRAVGCGLLAASSSPWSNKSKCSGSFRWQSFPYLHFSFLLNEGLAGLGLDNAPGKASLSLSAFDAAGSTASDDARSSSAGAAAFPAWEGGGERERSRAGGLVGPVLPTSFSRGGVESRLIKSWPEDFLPPEGLLPGLLDAPRADLGASSSSSHGCAYCAKCSGVLL